MAFCSFMICLCPCTCHALFPFFHLFSLQHIQLQNANTKRWSQLLLFVQNDPWLAFCTVAQVLPFYVAKIWRRIQKQEPHTKMWGTTLLHGTLSHLTSTCISCTHRPPPSLFSFLPFPSHFHLSLVTYWKKLTCGVIRTWTIPGLRFCAAMWCDH